MIWPMAITDTIFALTRSGADRDNEFNGSLSGRLNWLRAGVLGANDGIVSTAAIILGVAGATSTRGSILLAGIVGLLAGAMSMAVGEYVSVSTQRDTERSAIARQRERLSRQPEAERRALAAIYVEKGLGQELADQVAADLSQHDALAAHAESRLGIDSDEFTEPWHASFASFTSFVIGAGIPLLGVVVAPTAWFTVVAVAVALAITGSVSARLGRAPVRGAVIRNMSGGLIAMGITFALGSLVGGIL